jgi:hypothetical protein
MRALGARFRSFAAVLFAATLGAVQVGCQSIDIASDWDPEVDFSKLSTYDWMPEPGPTGPGPGSNDSLTIDRVHRSVDRILAARGYVLTPTGTPDFLVGYYGAVESKLDVTTLNDYYGYRPGWGYAGYGGSSRTYVREYEQGTLILDISNPHNSKLMWRGSAQAEVSQTETPEEREAIINEAVGLILKRFPPGTSQ